ncbi:MAG: hypothetical protein QXW10_01235 [Candidatus Micrarchaeaceae archaeon]
MDSQGDYSDKIVGVISIFDGEVPYLRGVCRQSYILESGAYHRGT